MAPPIWNAAGLVIKMQLSGLKVCRGRRQKVVDTIKRSVCLSADSVALHHKATQVLQ